jgi:hypothetical protein
MSGRGSPAPPPPPAAAAGSTKKHIQKPDNFLESKDWDKFHRQAFVYMEEYENDFTSDASQIHFLLSFFKGGLPEKFAANYIDKIMVQTTIPKDWGTIVDFGTACRETFMDKNKKSNAENQIALLKQGGKTAKEFFQEFDQVARIAGYDDTHHDDVLIKLVRDAAHSHIIDSIYRQDTLSTLLTWVFSGSLLGQFLEICPCCPHLKHRPSALALSMSIRCPLPP